MIYSVSNTAGIGKPVRVLRPDGSEITYVVDVDTDTGMVTRFVTDERGKRQLNDSRTELLRETLTVPGVRVELVSVD